MTYNLPAVRWLAKKDPEAALAVLQRIRDEGCNYGSEVEPAYLDPRDRSADDIETHIVPDEALTSETMTESVSDGPDEIYPEMLHEVKPDLHGMLRSAGGVAMPWCGVRWRNRRTGKVRWTGEPWAYMFCCLPHIPEKHTTTIGGLTFYTKPASPENRVRRGQQGGILVSYIDDAGKLRRPAYRASKPRGGKRPYRLDPWGYLAVKPTTSAPMDARPYQRALSGEPALMPMYTPLLPKAPDALDPQGRYGVEEARAELKAFGVDGGVAFADLPFPATKCPTDIARGARFIGGVSGRSQTASHGVIGKVEEPPKLEAGAEEIVDEVAARGTLESIGLKLGYHGGYADRAGGKALLEAGKAILAANDNNREKVAA